MRVSPLDGRTHVKKIITESFGASSVQYRRKVLTKFVFHCHKVGDNVDDDPRSCVMLRNFH